MKNPGQNSITSAIYQLIQRRFFSLSPGAKHMVDGFPAWRRPTDPNLDPKKRLGNGS
jgi:hypothetical protein